jgi:conjugative transfer signal peptidase TraF
VGGDARTGRRRSWLTGPVVAASLGLLVCATCGFRLTYNTTPSLPIGIYRIEELAREPRRGDFVGVCLEGETARLALARGYVHRQALEPYVYRVRCPSGTAIIGKPVVGVPGDTVELDRNGVRINGETLPGGAVVVRDSRGRRMPHPEWGRRILASDEYWAQSPYSPRSFDSRYFGPVRRQQIADVRLPIVVVPPAVPAAPSRGG